MTKKIDINELNATPLLTTGGALTGGLVLQGALTHEFISAEYNRNDANYGYNQVFKRQGVQNWRQAFGSTATLDDYILSNAAGTPVITALQNTNIGIGTPVPLQKTHTHGGNLAVTNGAYNIQGSTDIYLAGGFTDVGSRAGTILRSTHFVGASTQFQIMEANRGASGYGDYTDGTVRFVINNSGNVGIGTTSPSNKLMVVETLSGLATMRLLNNHGSGFAGTEYMKNDGSTVGAYVGLESNGLSFKINTIGQNLIIPSGNVGIGTTTPSGHALALYRANSNTSQQLETGSGNYAFTRLKSGSTFWDVALNDSLVNISEGQTRLEFRKSGGGAHRISIDDGFIGIYGNSIRNVFLNANGNSYFNGGNLGVGTIAPTEKLDVNGNIKMGTNPTLSWISNSLSLVSATDAISVVQVKGTPSFNPRFEVWDANNVNQIVNLTAGSSWINANFGIGANNVPKSKLDVRGDFQTIIGAGYGVASDNIHTFMSAGADANNNGFIKGYGFKITTTASTLGDAKFSIGYNTAYNVTHEYPTSLTEVMTFDRGKVGIGTTTPLSRLHMGNITSNPTNLTIQALAGAQKTIIYMSGVTTKWVVGMHSSGSLNNDWNIGTSHNVSNFVVKANGDIHTNGNTTIPVGPSDNKLQIHSDINMTGDIYKNGVLIGGGGGSAWTTSGNNIYYTSGKVSIGASTNSGSELDIVNNANNSTCSLKIHAGAAGTNSTLNKAKIIGEVVGNFAGLASSASIEYGDDGVGMAWQIVDAGLTIGPGGGTQILSVNGNCNVTGTIYSGDGTVSVSDRRMKTGIVDSTLGLSFIMKIRPVEYYMTKDLQDDKPVKQYGMIAQEVEELVAVEDFGGLKKTYNKGSKEVEYGLRYEAFIAPMIKAAQEQQSKMNELESRLKQLTKVVEEFITKNTGE